MLIKSLQITDFRNISSTLISCSPKFNAFYGDNAAGKTSILELIYYLSTGKSFRTSHLDRIIRHTHDKFTLFAQLNSENSDAQVGIQRSRNGAVLIRLNEESISSIAQISQYLPVQMITSSSHRILVDGPKCRRQFLDWGLFYTCPHFYPQWQQYQKLLRHRNAALKARASRDELLIWNHELAVSGNALDALRQNYIEQFLPVFYEIIATLLNDMHINVEYTAGWDKASALEACLSKNVSRETMLGYTLYGPHRADLVLTVDNLPAQDVLSQGQQKLVSYSLRLAQGLHLQSATAKTPIYLIDDLPAELDPQKRRLVTEILSRIQAQVFITGIESSDLMEILALNSNNRMFHVEHGAIEAVLPHNLSLE